MVTALDAYTRQQVFVEGVKAGEDKESDGVYDAIIAAVIMALTKRGITSVGDLSKKELGKLLTEVRATVHRLLSKHIRLTDKKLGQFALIIAKHTKAIENELGKGKAFSYGNGKPIKVDPDRLVAGVRNQPINGLGITMAALLAEHMSGALSDIVKALTIAWAEKQALAETVTALVGTKATKGKGSVVAKLKRRLKTAVKSAFQHVTSEVVYQIGRIRHTHYMWCSVLDDRTTELCRHRNGLVFKFGEGPKPPAHYNCRSHIMPVTITEPDDMPTYFSWLKKQPNAIQNEALGVSRAASLRAGKLKADDLPGFDGARPLTLPEYADKLNDILT